MTSSKTTKRALLSSALAVMLCVAMLIGTTFAWFTDSAQTGVNRIQAGNLKVDLVDEEGNSLVNRKLAFKNVAGESENILWEPGCRYELESFRVVNKGNLALKFSIQITGISGNAKLNEVLTWSFSDTYANGVGQLLPGDQTEPIIITAIMDENAGNEYQDQFIDGISITVNATQLPYEEDSIGSFYDANAPFVSYWDGAHTELPEEEDGVYRIATAAEFVGLMNNAQSGGASVYTGKSIVLENDIDLGGATVKGFGNEGCIFGASFDGKGHTVSNFNIDRSDKEDFAGLFNYYCYGTLQNLTVKNATVKGISKVGVLVGGVYDNAKVQNCKVENCTVIADRKAGGIIGYAQQCNVSKCAVKGTTVYAVNTDENQSGKIIGYKNTGLVEGSGENANTADATTTVQRNSDIIANGVVKANATTYEISNAAGLNWFNDQINNKGNSFNYQTVKLVADINMNGAKWLPAGQNFKAADYPTLGYANTVEFHGVFDGNGKTVSNINISGFTAEELKQLDNRQGSTTDMAIFSVGFFGYTNGVVKNLTLKNATVKGSHNVGAVVGYTDSASYIENCHVENSRIEGAHLNDEQCGDKVGGIVGFLNDTVSGADIKGCTVKNSTVAAGRDAGQVIGCAVAGSEQANCSATNVTVSVLAGCSGININNTVVGRQL